MGIAAELVSERPSDGQVRGGEGTLGRRGAMRRLSGHGNGVIGVDSSVDVTPESWRVEVAGCRRCRARAVWAHKPACFARRADAGIAGQIALTRAPLGLGARWRKVR